MRKRRKTPGLFMKRMVAVLIAAALIYTVVIIVVFIKVGSEPSTLTENVFQFLSVEGGAMALIRSVKSVTEKKKNSDTEVKG